MTTATKDAEATIPVNVSETGMISVEISEELFDAKYTGCGRAFAVISQTGVVDFEYITKKHQVPSAELTAKGHVYDGMMSCCRLCID